METKQSTEVDYNRLPQVNQAFSSVTAALPDVVYLPKQINSLDYLVGRRIRSSHSHGEKTVHTQSCPTATSILLLSVIILSEELSVQMDILQIITSAHYMDDVMFVVPDEPEVASVLDTLERHACSRRRRNPERFRSLIHRQSF